MKKLHKVSTFLAILALLCIIFFEILYIGTQDEYYVNLIIISTVSMFISMSTSVFTNKVQRKNGTRDTT